MGLESLGLDLNALMQQVEQIKKAQNEHVTIANVTFKKADLKRAEPFREEGQPNKTQIHWVDKSEDPTILNINIVEFNKQFYK